MIGQRTRVALEREKMLALRSIKELEFDRAMGKLSDSDWHEMSGRLRARASRLMRQLDAGSGYRDQIERDLAKRLGTAAAPSDAAGRAGSTPCRVRLVRDRQRCGCAVLQDRAAEAVTRTRISTEDTEDTRGQSLLGAMRLVCSSRPWRPAWCAASCVSSRCPIPNRWPGIPRPVTDLPDGAVSVRLIRGQLSNNIPNFPVELHVGSTGAYRQDRRGGTRGVQRPAGRSDAQGGGGRRRRASRVGSLSRAGARRHPPAARRDRHVEGRGRGTPARLRPPGRSSSAASRASSSSPARKPSRSTTCWTSSTARAGRSIRRRRSSSTCRVERPATGILEGSSPNASAKDQRVTVQGPFASGRTLVQVGAMVPAGQASLQLTQRFPVAVDQLAVVVKKVGGITLSSPQLSRQQEMTASGETYIAGDRRRGFRGTADRVDARQPAPSQQRGALDCPLAHRRDHRRGGVAESRTEAVHGAARRSASGWRPAATSCSTISSGSSTNTGAARSTRAATRPGAKKSWLPSSTSTGRSTATRRAPSPPTARASLRERRLRSDLAGRRHPTFRTAPRRLARQFFGAPRRDRRSPRTQRRRQVDPDRHGGHAGVAEQRGSALWGPVARGTDGPALRARIGLLAHELHLYPELSARQNLTFFASLYGVDAGGRVDAALAVRRPVRPRRTTTCPGSRAGCGSASRSSARCCTGRVSCCSTSRSPASTTVPSGSSPIGCSGSPRTAPSWCWPRTISISPRAWSRAWCCSATAG